MISDTMVSAYLSDLAKKTALILAVPMWIATVFFVVRFIRHGPEILLEPTVGTVAVTILAVPLLACGSSFLADGGWRDIGSWFLFAICAIPFLLMLFVTDPGGLAAWY